MDQRLIPADSGAVRRLIARAYLGSPVIAPDQGEIRLAPHQVDAASRIVALLHQWGGAVLADATGLGKTFVAIAVARLHTPAMVVAPAALRAMWHESLGRAGVEARVESYEGLSRDNATGCRPGLLILDEAHHARNPATRRYARLADLAWGTKVLLLTATPVHNRTRDLRALVALFLGSRAHEMDEDELLCTIVRRTTSGGDSVTLPAVREPRWLEVPSDADTLASIVALPPAAQVADGTPAHALMLLGLIRAWSSSEAALRETLRRRLRRAASLTAALDSGQFPSRRELAAWPVVGDAIQLGMAGLFGVPDERGRRIDIDAIRSTLDRHVEGVRSILRYLDRNDSAADRRRVQAVRSIMKRSPVPVIAFTQFADTAVAMFRNVVSDGGVALVTGKGARVASGQVSVDEIVRGFDVMPDEARNAAMPLRLLVASDVLSEGLSLRRAGVLIHLDLPWTIARLEQRVGRLRRIGSAHSLIDVYAIGPPVSARELVPVVRALQRKARLSGAIIGTSELTSSLPLLGQRLARATATLGDEGTGSAERLRAVLGQWLGEAFARSTPGHTSRDVMLALISQCGGYRLLAADESGISDHPLRLVETIDLLGDGGSVPAPATSPPSTELVDRWLAEQRGRELARSAADIPSAAHAEVLRRLHDRLSGAPRFERKALGSRVDALRRLVLAARGIGAERALVQLCHPALDLDALEQVLGPRTAAQPTGVEPRLVAVLSLDGAWIAE